MAGLTIEEFHEFSRDGIPLAGYYGFRTEAIGDGTARVRDRRVAKRKTLEALENAKVRHATVGDASLPVQSQALERGMRRED